jgi:hypothetical protein
MHGSLNIKFKMSFDVLCHTGVMEYNKGIAICERYIEVLSYVAYVRVRKVLPYCSENCVSLFYQATREQVRGTVVYTSDPNWTWFFRSSKPRQTSFKFIAMAN